MVSPSRMAKNISFCYIKVVQGKKFKFDLRSITAVKFDTGYRFKSGRETYKFLLEIYDRIPVEGINFFIDESKDPKGIVILRFEGSVNLGLLDAIASKFGGERMYLPSDWRIRYANYEFKSIESWT